jgi:undecaprenyl-diphosphatase
VAVAILTWRAADRIDVRFVTWVHRTAPEALVDAMRVLTHAGSAPVLGAVALAAALYLMQRGRPSAAAYVVAAFVAGQLVTQGLKAVFRRTRPALDDPYIELATYAFPSGHALGATATYGAILVVLWPQLGRARAVVTVGIGSLVLVVAASRVTLGAHYLLDVVAGMLGGVAVLAGLLLVFDAAPRGRRSFSFRTRHEQTESVGLDRHSQG